MRRRLTALLACLALLLTLMPSAALAAEGEAVAIRDREGLAALASGGSHRGERFYLAADIDLGGAPWTPIPSFEGALLGAGHTVRGLNVVLEDSDAPGGLFGEVGADGLVMDLTVEGTVSVQSARGRAGGIAGVCRGELVNCAFLGDLTVEEPGNNSYVGGIAGRVYGTLRDCRYEGTLTGRKNDYAGGVAGHVDAGGSLTDCSSAGTVQLSPANSSYSYAGGIAGDCAGEMSGCWTSAVVRRASSNDNVGGVTGAAGAAAAITGCWWPQDGGLDSGAASGCTAYTDGESLCAALGEGWAVRGGLPARTYPIQVGQYEYGAVSASAESALPGAAVLLTVSGTPTSLSVGGVRTRQDWDESIGKALDLTENGDGTWSFTMPGWAVEVAATFEKPAPQAPKITGQTERAEADYGSVTGTLSVEAEGENLSYQWYAGTPGAGSPIPGADGAVFSIPADLKAGEYEYYCVVAAGADGPETVSAAIPVTVRPRAVSLTGLTAKDRDYDGTCAVTLDGYRLENTVEGDDVTAEAVGRLETPGAGAGKAVTVEARLAGTDAGNYTLEPPAGCTVTINRAELTVTAEDAVIYPGQALPGFTARYEGFVAGEGAEVLGGALTFDCAATPASGPGAYAITPSGLTSENYHIVFQPGTLTVAAAEEAPADAWSVPLPDGEHGWYRQGFAIRPGPGYTIARTLTGPFSAAPISVPQEDAPSGQMTFYLEDGAGKRYAAVLSYRMDATAPTLRWAADTAALDSGRWYAQADLCAEGADTCSGLGEIVLTVTKDGGAPWESRDGTARLEESGVYAVTATAKDAAGNSSALEEITVRIEAAIGELDRQVKSLDSNSSYAAVSGVRAWYAALPAGRQARVSSSPEGSAALARLSALEAEQHAAAGVFADAVGAVARPLAPEDRAGAEALRAQYGALGDKTALVPAEALRAYESLAALLDAVERAEAACAALPGHLPEAGCADLTEHRALAERAALACAALTEEGRALAPQGALTGAETQYRALMDALGYVHERDGIAVYGLTENVDTSPLTAGGQAGEIRVVLNVARSNPEADLSQAEEALREELPELRRVSSYGLKLEAELHLDGAVVKRAEVQPKAGEPVTVRLPIEKGVKENSLRILHVSEAGIEPITAESNGLRLVGMADNRAALFEAAHFSHFVMYAETDGETTSAASAPTRYRVTVDCGPGGTVSPRFARVERGESIEFTLKPDKGYYITGLLLDGSSVLAELVGPEEDGSCRLRVEHVKKAHILKVVFEAVEAPWIAEAWNGHWAAQAYSYAVARGIMDAEAVPDALVTRGAFAGMLLRASNLPEGTDVLAWAQSEGLLLGDASGALLPERALTRQELAVMLWRAAGQRRVTVDSTDFVDGEEVAEWAREAVAYCREAGLLQGKPGGRFAPFESVTQAEAAVLFSRLP